MGAIIDLAAARAARRASGAVVDLRLAQSRHPALRYAVDGSSDAHRRSPTGVMLTMCGLPGPFARATSDAPLCPGCYPGLA